MPEDNPSGPGLPPLRPARGHRVWMAVLAAFALGIGAAGWLAWRGGGGGDFRQFLGIAQENAGLAPDGGGHAPPSSAPEQSNAAPDTAALSGRMAALEQRLDRLDQRVTAGSSDTAHAEALLVAFAVRRLAERGAPLGYLADQLKLRFGDAQPNAVATIISDARDLMPLDRLAARLEALAPQLTTSGQQTLWNRVSRELSTLFVIRSDRPAPSDADAQLNDARLALSEGRIDDAIAAVQRLSNGPDVANWAAAARRYRDVERALDLIDTTALLAPRPLRDGPVAQVQG